MEPIKKSDLTKRSCHSCEGGATPLSISEAQSLLKQVHGWQLADTKLEREFVFRDFLNAMKFVNSVAQLAETEGHHPDFHIHYNKVRLELWTHDVSSLTENDFVLAAKINEID